METITGLGEKFLIKNVDTHYFGDALLKYSVGDYLGVKRELSSIIDNGFVKENVEVYYLLGLTEYHLGNFEKSIDYFVNSIQLRPVNFESGFCHFHLGRCNYELTNYIKAKQDFLNALDLLPAKDETIDFVHFFLGLTEINLENYDFGIIELNLFISNNKYFPVSYIWRAYCNLQLGEKKEACEDIKRAIRFGIDDLDEILLKYCL